MKRAKDGTYTRQQAEDHELSRRLDLMEAEGMVSAIPSRQRAKKRVVVGDRVFSLQDMLDEIRAGTVLGETFRAMFKRMRAARIRMEKP